MHPHLFLTLRALHVLAGSLWVGAAVLNAVFVIPSIMAAGPAGGQVMRVMAQVRRLPVFMNVIMFTTLLSGIVLYWVSSSGFQWAWISSGSGMAFTFGAVLALVTAGIGQWVTVPTVKRLGQLGAAVAASGGPPSPQQAAEMAALQRTLLGAAQMGTLLVVAAALFMAVARYV